MNSKNNLWLQAYARIYLGPNEISENSLEINAEDWTGSVWIFFDILTILVYSFD